MQDQLDFIYEAGQTLRFHTVPLIRPQSIADHSWHVTMLGFILYGQEEPGVRMPFIMALMTHDMAECRMGDLPSPAKRRMDTLLELEDQSTSFREQWNAAEQEVLRDYAMDWEDQLDVEEQRRFKVVDAMEGAMRCVRERMMGNRLVAEAYKNFVKYIGELMVAVSNEVPLNPRPLTIHEREWELFTYIKAQWEAIV